MNSAIETAKERAGMLLVKKDEQEARHSLKKTSQQIYDDFLFDLSHPFMAFLDKRAAEFERTGEPFILWREIAYMTKDPKSTASLLYRNDGVRWKQSGNALVTKFLKERYQNLNIPKIGYMSKGTELLLKDNPDGYGWLREVLKDRFEEEE